MKKTLLYIALIAMTLILLLRPTVSVEYARKGLSLCNEMIVPSLFPFFICSGLLIYSGFCQVLSKVFAPVMQPVFRINGSGAAAFILGIISGYPLGALTACQLYESNYVSKSEAERLLAFCNNSGPLFILGAVGVSLYHSPRIGAILYIAHILAALTVGILFRFYRAESHQAPVARLETKAYPPGELFSVVLSNSLQSIFTVCGAVLFFSVISNILLDLIPLSDWLRPILSGIFEFVSGVTALANSDFALEEKLILSAAIVGFAGICVHIQVMGVVCRHMLSLKPYIFGKVLHSFLSAGYTFLILQIVPVTAPVFRPAGNALCGGFAMSSLYTGLCVGIVVVLCIFCAAGLALRELRRIKGDL